ncbi:extracellular solute-binding protein [Defluviitalea phaphyphila]|uniref:extracellular solute-binding protein n=1 Tax=Defluviitalea phaphyphila TaxID=1473580 RepID=UPI00073178F6|nr:extracellular solute-binding protein [Defluviitalea phaphyphila]
MKNIFKRTGIFVMIIIMITSLLSGCGKTTEETISNENSNMESQDESNKEMVSADTPGWKEDTSPITFDWYLNFSWFANQWGGDETSKYITEKTGVNINFIVPAGNEAEKLNTMIVSDTLPDFITLGWWESQVDTMIEGGLVYPLNELADKYDPYFYTVADPARLGWYTEEDGNVYGYPNASYSPSDYEKYDIYSNQTFLVRKDMYEAIGSPDMRTPEGFLDALRKAKEMFPEVNGQPLIPFGAHEFTDTGNYSFETYLQNFLAIPREKDGKLYDRTTDPEYIRWLKVFRQANEEGLIAKDIFVDKRAQMEEKITQGRYFCMLYQNWDMQAPQKALYSKDPNSVYIAVPGPANSNLDDPTLDGGGIAGWTITMISKNCKDPERAIKFLSYLMSEEGQKDVFLGPKGVTYDTIDGKDQLKPEVKELLSQDRSAFDKMYGCDNTYWMLMDLGIQSQWTPELEEPLRQPQEWTKPYVQFVGQYDNITPPTDSEEGIILSKIQNKWGTILPQLILAESEEEFDAIFNEFLQYREEQGYEKVVEYMQKKVDENKEKLGIK